MTYRVSAEPVEPIDGEAIAIAALGRRAQRLRRAIHVPVLLVGIGLGIAAYVMLREILLARFGGHVPYLTGALTFGPMFALAVRVAPRLGNAAAARALPRWRAELARRYGLDEAVLAETTQFS